MAPLHAFRGRRGTGGHPHDRSASRGALLDGVEGTRGRRAACGGGGGRRRGGAARWPAWPPGRRRRRRLAARWAPELGARCGGLRRPRVAGGVRRRSARPVRARAGDDGLAWRARFGFTGALHAVERRGVSAANVAHWVRDAALRGGHVARRDVDALVRARAQVAVPPRPSGTRPPRPRAATHAAGTAPTLLSFWKYFCACVRIWTTVRVSTSAAMTFHSLPCSRSPLINMSCSSLDHRPAAQPPHTRQEDTRGRERWTVHGGVACRRWCHERRSEGRGVAARGWVRGPPRRLCRSSATPAPHPSPATARTEPSTRWHNSTRTSVLVRVRHGHWAAHGRGAVAQGGPACWAGAKCGRRKKTQRWLASKIPTTDARGKGAGAADAARSTCTEEVATVRGRTHQGTRALGAATVLRTEASSNEGAAWRGHRGAPLPSEPPREPRARWNSLPRGQLSHVHPRGSFTGHGIRGQVCVGGGEGRRVAGRSTGTTRAEVTLTGLGATQPKSLGESI